MKTATLSQKRQLYLVKTVTLHLKNGNFIRVIVTVSHFRLTETVTFRKKTATFYQKTVTLSLKTVTFYQKKRSLSDNGNF